MGVEVGLEGDDTNIVSTPPSNTEYLGEELLALQDRSKSVAHCLDELNDTILKTSKQYKTYKSQKNTNTMSAIQLQCLMQCG